MTPAPLDDPRFDAARAVHEAAGVVDLHVDAVIQNRLFGYDLSKEHRPGRYGQPRWNHADVPRMQSANYRGACLGVHWFPFQSERGWRGALKQLDVIDALCAADERVQRVRTASDWEAARAAGKLALAPGVEGAHMLNGRLERVDELGARGVAYLTLAHFSKNDAATPSMGLGANERDGLSDFGRALVARLEANGILIDVAHLNMACAREACDLATGPLFCTHTGAKAVYDHPRNISDDVIDRIAERDGAIGIIFSPHFLAGSKHAGTEALVAHAKHIRDRVGARHLCIGSDYDGWLPAIFSDHRDCRDTLRVTAGLLEAGFSEEEVAGVLSDNALRVLRSARRSPGSN